MGALIAAGLAFWFYEASSGPNQSGPVSASGDISSLFEEAPAPVTQTTPPAPDSTEPPRSVPRKTPSATPTSRPGKTAPTKSKKARKRAACTDTSPVEVSLNTKPYSSVTINNQREGDTKWKGKCDRGTHQVVFESANLKTPDGQPKTHRYTLKIEASTRKVSYCWNFSSNAICGN